MKNTAKHFIYTLYFELQFGINKEAYRLPAITRQKFYEEILPVIDRVLDAVPPGVHLRIPKLEIDAGMVTMEELKLVVEKALKEMIQNAGQGVMPTGDSAPAPAHDLHLQPGAYWHKEEAGIPDEYAVFFHFIKTGTLPWHKYQPAQINLKYITRKLVSFTGQQSTASATFNTFIYNRQWELESIFLDPHARHRLLMHTTPGQLFILLHAIRPAIKPENNTLLVALLQRWQKSKKAGLSYITAATLAIEHYLYNQLPGDSLYVLQQNTQWRHIFTRFIQTEATDEDRAWLEAFLQPAPVSETHTVFETHTEKHNVLPENTFPLHKPAGDLPGIAAELHIIVAEGMAVYNAGLILLWPFLPVFFGALGLCKESRFTSNEAQVQAVQVLHYLVFRTAGTPEYMLPLNKVLCGLPVEQPVPPRFTITRKIKTECRHLLEEATKQWTVLRNSSPEGFSNAFLKRNGILKYTEEAWELRVEPKGKDILLDSLPWSIQLVKYNWNDYLLHTEWDRV